MMNHNGNITLTLDGINTIGQCDSIVKNKHTYFQHVKSNRKLFEYYKDICNDLINVSEENADANKEEQVGGNALAIGGIAALTIIIGVAAWMYLKNNKPSCPTQFPMVRLEVVPSVGRMLSHMLPKSWIGDPHRDPMMILKEAKDKLNTLLAVFSALKEDTTMDAVKTHALKITASVAAAVGTGGMGGDIIVSLTFTIKYILETIQSIVNGIYDIMSDTSSVRLLYDMMLINFSMGPKGVKCWMRHILKVYGSGNKAYGVVCALFKKIMGVLSKFIGNALGSVIPDSVGIPGLLVPLIIKFAEKRAFGMIETQLDKYYAKIPDDMQAMLENPSLFKKYLDRKIDSGRKYLLGFGSKLFDVLKENTDMFSMSISRGFAIIYSLIYLFLSCSPSSGIENNSDSSNSKLVKSRKGRFSMVKKK